MNPAKAGAAASVFSPYSVPVPLSHRTYDRIMQAAMILLLGSLLGLGWLWKPRWKMPGVKSAAIGVEPKRR